MTHPLPDDVNKRLDELAKLLRGQPPDRREAWLEAERQGDDDEEKDREAEAET